MPESIVAVAWSPDGFQVATANHQGTIQIWESLTGNIVNAFTGHTSYITNLAWSPDGTRLASSSNDQTAIIWSPVTGQALQTLSGHNQVVTALSWIDNSRLITGTDGIDLAPSLFFWDTNTGALVTRIDGVSAGGLIWSPDRRLIAIPGVIDLKVVDSTTFDVRMILRGDISVDAAQGYYPSAVDWSSDSNSIAVGYRNGSIRIWNVLSGQICTKSK